MLENVLKSSGFFVDNLTVFTLEEKLCVDDDLLVMAVVVPADFFEISDNLAEMIMECAAFKESSIFSRMWDELVSRQRGKMWDELVSRQRGKMWDELVSRQRGKMWDELVSRQRGKMWDELVSRQRGKMWDELVSRQRGKMWDELVSRQRGKLRQFKDQIE